ncbi:Putative signal transduction histidine kinase [Cyclobacterium amurskyense]|uniref:Putative signal transduction histidine kinase n=2 Tax=Cyclobacterium amurskyense TaxID=320787 RepID=A0A0H4PZ81_9BACT|nr:Putative signal transduction histidine kinase [Cyclobacterium amurskyense]
MLKIEKKVILKTLVHVLILGVILSPVFFIISNKNQEIRPNFYFSISNSSIIIFYLINIIWLIPKLIFQRKYLKYALFLTSFLALYIFFQYTFMDFSPIGGDRPSPRFPDGKRQMFFWIPSFFRFILIMALGTVIELITKFEQEHKKFDELERQKIIKELNFLKNQLNPHFLFNALNNIYSLASRKSENTTPSIMLLSNMLRYVLYESGKDKVPIHQEVDFIKNYVNLEKLKFSDNNAPQIKCYFSLTNENYTVEPLLFITLIENAFKHGISYVTPSFILISFKEDNNEILLSVINSIGKRDDRNINTNKTGVGIENLKKRLKLLYPGKHSFKQIHENSTFKAFLKIKK